MRSSHAIRGNRRRSTKDSHSDRRRPGEIRHCDVSRDADLRRSLYGYFAEIGLPGLSSFVNYARGDTPDSGSNAAPDQRELDITIDYRFQSRVLKGLWLRARAAFVDQDNDVGGTGDVEDIRLILNYDLPIL